jgi:hypothetical protein
MTSTVLLASVDADYCFMTVCVFKHMAKTVTGVFSKHLNSKKNTSGKAEYHTR